MEGTTHPGRTYWAIAIISLLWNAFGAYDYVMTQTRNADYLAAFPPETLTFLDAMPAWVSGAWAIGVWGSLLGSILLLVRSRWAVAAFALSLLGLAASTLYQAMIGMPPAMTTAPMLAMQGVIWAVLIFLLWYGYQARGKGWLQ